MKLETRVKSGDLFDKLGKENEEETRRFEVVNNPRLKEICRKYERWMKGFIKRFGNMFEEFREYRIGEYERAISVIGSNKYSSNDISHFSLQLKKYEKEENFLESGIFASALINTSLEERFVVVTYDLSPPISYIGFCNKKKVLIKGDCGYNIGEEMEGGEIRVEGNCGDDLGRSMIGGLIIIKGNAGDRVGNSAKAGLIILENNAGDQLGFNMGRWVGRDIKHAEILVEGDVGDEVGKYMQGGIIYMNGNYKSLSEDIERGQIYHKCDQLRIKRRIK